MSIDTKKVVRAQLWALGDASFELGIQEAKSGTMKLRAMSAEAILDAIASLKWRNWSKHFIRIRPKWPHSFFLVDDLGVERVQELKARALCPCVVVETSPGNHQAWLDLGRCVRSEVMTRIARHMALVLRTDRGAANFRQAGALAGFTNCKERHRRPDGLYPFVRLHLARRRVCARAGALVRDAERLETRARTHWARFHSDCIARRYGSVRPIECFHASPRYEGDLHRADFAWALHALLAGQSETQVFETILRARDLRHKGPRREQVRYARRTVRSAHRKGVRRAFDARALASFDRRGTRR